MGMVGAGRGSVLGHPVLPRSRIGPTKRTGWMFAGYIPLRRGILEHVQKGFLNKTDFSIYCLLLLLADHHAGIWWGSGKALGLYNFPRSTAQKSLQRLESKGYIKRFPIPGVHSNYQILINKYAITDGQHKGLLLDAKQTTSTNRIVYVKQHMGEHLVEHVGEHVGPIQEGRIEKKEKRKNIAQASPSLWFDKFWEAYPRGSAEFPRRVGKPVAQKAWNKAFYLGAEWNKIMAGLERWKQTEQWQKEGGKFIPYPATFLNQRRWEDEPPEDNARGLSGIRLDKQFEELEQRRQGKLGKCSDCGAEIPVGFLKCLTCLAKAALHKAKPPVNP